MRKTQFENGEYYHVYNRGVDNRDVFMDERDYLRFLKSIVEFNNNSTHDQRVYIKNRSLGKAGETELRSEASELRIRSRDGETELRSEASERSSVRDLRDFFNSFPPFVEIICYCLNPNHFHLLLKQLVDNGIEKFMHKLSSGYTNYFNLKNKRSGYLFEGPFKSVKIDSEEHLLWVSAYVNGNAQIHGIADDAEKYKWCSYPEYLGKNNSNICIKSVVLDKFMDAESFQKVSEEGFMKMKERKNLQKYIID